MKSGKKFLIFHLNLKHCIRNVEAVGTIWFMGKYSHAVNRVRWSIIFFCFTTLAFLNYIFREFYNSSNLK